LGKTGAPPHPANSPLRVFFNHHHLMNPTTDQLLSFLSAFDVPGRSVPVGTVSAFLAVAEGCDHVSDLSARLGTPPRTTARLVKLLAGRPRWHEGAWIESPFALVDLRPHPHRGGEQYRLSEQGEELLERLRSRPDGLLRTT
jgi:hypothetical protein